MTPNDFKARYFGAHIGCPMNVILNSGEYRETIVSAGTTTLLNDEDHLLLKPLSQISEDDDIEICNIIGAEISDFYLRSLDGKNKYMVNPYKSLAAIDHLRSAGYALPFGGKLVDELVSEGLLKLL